MTIQLKAFRTGIFFTLTALLFAACSSRSGIAARPNLVDSAAAEATAIIQQAQATALLLQAQAQATAVMAQAQQFGSSLESQPASTIEPSRRQSVLPASASSTPEAQQVQPEIETPEGVPSMDEQVVEILRVSFAAETGFIFIQFYAPPDEAEKWWQGSVSVTDEATGTVYNEIPEMPKIGPLIGRPQIYGQIGFVMLTNLPAPLQPGAVVTVRLGNYTFEHIPVE